MLNLLPLIVLLAPEAAPDVVAVAEPITYRVEQIEVNWFVEDSKCARGRSY